MSLVLAPVSQAGYALICSLRHLNPGSFLKSSQLSEMPYPLNHREAYYADAIVFECADLCLVTSFFASSAAFAFAMVHDVLIRAAIGITCLMPFSVVIEPGQDYLLRIRNFSGLHFAFEFGATTSAEGRVIIHCSDSFLASG